jgi:hypothetical protein
MLRLAFALLMVGSPCWAQSAILDLSKPQTESFSSIIDLRGRADLKPNEGLPAEVPAVPAAPLLVSFEPKSAPPDTAGADPLLMARAPMTAYQTTPASPAWPVYRPSTSVALTALNTSASRSTTEKAQAAAIKPSSSRPTIRLRRR